MEKKIMSREGRPSASDYTPEIISELTRKAYAKALRCLYSSLEEMDTEELVKVLTALGTQMTQIMKLKGVSFGDDTKKPFWEDALYQRSRKV